MFSALYGSRGAEAPLGDIRGRRRVWLEGLAVAVAAFCSLPGTAAAFRAHLDGTVWALAVYQGELIAGGDFMNADGTPAAHIARWDGTRWRPLGNGTDGSVRALVVLGQDLIAGGDFTRAGDQPAAYIARWNGSSWGPLGSGTDGPVFTLAQKLGVFLYAGGSFRMAGGAPAHGAAQWFFGTWSALGQGLDGMVESLTIAPNGRVVACGALVNRSSGVGVKIAAFANGIWLDENESLGVTPDALLHAVHAHSSALFMGGLFTTVWWSTPGFAVSQKSGSVWQALGAGLFGPGSVASGEVFSLASYASRLVAGGLFVRFEGGDARNVAAWNGTNWAALGTGVDGPVFALAEYQGDLIAGGAFSEAGGVSASNIATWNGSQWMPLVTAVTLQELRVSRRAASIDIEWSLVGEGLDELRALLVQRALAPEGPFDLRARLVVRPGPARFVDNDVGTEVRYFYRLGLERRDGSVAASVVLQAWPVGGTLRDEILGAVAPGGGEPVHITYRIGRDATPIRLSVFDVRGLRVQTIAAGRRDAGEHAVTWDQRRAQGGPTAPGLYFVGLEVPGGRSTRKLLLAH